MMTGSCIIKIKYMYMYIPNPSSVCCAGHAFLYSAYSDWHFAALVGWLPVRTAAHKEKTAVCADAAICRGLMRWWW